MRLSVVAMIGAVVVGISGCEKPKERMRDEAAITAAIEQARREEAEADRQMRERAAQQEQDRREAEQAAIDWRAAGDDVRRATLTRFEQQLRATLIDPASLQIRNQRLAADGAALCAEVSAKNKQGVYGGFRRVIVTDGGVSFDRDPDDNDRPPEHRFAAIAKVTG